MADPALEKKPAPVQFQGDEVKGEPVPPSAPAEAQTVKVRSLPAHRATCISAFEQSSSKEDSKNRADFYMAAAALHLQRQVQLADTEWKVSLAFWTALLVSGVTFISFTNNATLPMTEYIAHSDYLFLLPYLFASGVFLFTFSINQAKSIVTERTRYRFCQNQAAKLSGSGFLIPHDSASWEADPYLPVEILAGGNRVWASKLLSTFSFVTGIWLSAQWLAHGKIDSEKISLAKTAAARAGEAASFAAKAAANGQADARVLATDAVRLEQAALAAQYQPLPPRCSLLECSSGNWPEPGTYIWLIAAILVAFFFIKTWPRDKL